MIAHCSKNLDAMKNLFRSLDNIISYQTYVKKKQVSTFFET